MAQRSLSSAVGDALLGFIELAWPKVAAGVDELLKRVADIAKPCPPMSLRTLDGQRLTGIVVVERGEATFFIGVREPASVEVAPPPRPTMDDVMPHWARDVDPYRR